ncbi:unnamed protein product [Amoebophrya sp. A25]|nr:unnamed protein product [Amoebophrya sp. A25]|eukprot:GSA25T00002173001.1
MSEPVEVRINEKPVFEEVDAEIVVIAGCALGFVSTTSPPHVLHIESGSILDKHGIGMDDILLRVNGTNVGNPFLGKEHIMKLLTEKLPLTLSFVKPQDAAQYLPNYKGGDEEEEAPEPPVVKKEKKRRKKSNQTVESESPAPPQREPRGPFEDSDDEANREGIRDSWTIKHSDHKNTGGVVLVERKNVAAANQGMQVGGVWMPPGRVPTYLQQPGKGGINLQPAPHHQQQHIILTPAANVNKGGASSSSAPAAPGEATDTILLQQLPPHLRSLVALTPHLAQMGFADVKNMRAMSSNTAMAVAFPTAARASECLAAINALGGFAGDPNIKARPYFKGRHKGGRGGKNDGAGGGHKGDGGNWNAEKGGDAAANGAAADADQKPATGQKTDKFENQTLESAELAAKRVEKQTVDEKKKVLIGHVTERMQQVMKRLQEPSLKPDHKAKYENILTQLKNKLTSLSALPKRKTYSEQVAEIQAARSFTDMKGSPEPPEPKSETVELKIHLKEAANVTADTPADATLLSQLGIDSASVASFSWMEAPVAPTEATKGRGDLPLDQALPTLTLRLPNMAVASKVMAQVDDSSSYAVTPMLESPQHTAVANPEYNYSGMDQ